jgi:hypothetical protein
VRQPPKAGYRRGAFVQVGEAYLMIKRKLQGDRVRRVRAKVEAAAHREGAAATPVRSADEEVVMRFG